MKNKPKGLETEKRQRGAAVFLCAQLCTFEVSTGLAGKGEEPAFAYLSPLHGEIRIERIFTDGAKRELLCM